MIIDGNPMWLACNRDRQAAERKADKSNNLSDTLLQEQIRQTQLQNKILESQLDSLDNS